MSRRLYPNRYRSRPFPSDPSYDPGEDYEELEESVEDARAKRYESLRARQQVQDDTTLT